MGFSTVPCNEFVEVLASKAPVPGGGGASALVGAVGTALGNMVGSLTVGKKKYADVEAEMYELKANATAFRQSCWLWLSGTLRYLSLCQRLTVCPVLQKKRRQRRQESWRLS